MQVLPMPDLQPRLSSLPRSMPAFPLVPEALQYPQLLPFHTRTSISPRPLAIQPHCLERHLGSPFTTLTSYLDLITSRQGKQFFYRLPKILLMKFYSGANFFPGENWASSVGLPFSFRGQRVRTKQSIQMDEGGHMKTQGTRAREISSPSIGGSSFPVKIWFQ